MSTINNSLKNDILKTIATGITIAIITSFLNYFLFIGQFKINKNDRIVNEKYNLLNKANDEFAELSSKQSDITFLDYYFDLKYKKWSDSLHLTNLPFPIHEKLRDELFKENPSLKSSLDIFSVYNFKFSNTLFTSLLYFKTEGFIKVRNDFEEFSGTAERRKVYEKYRDEYMKSNKVELDKINPYIIADSMLNFYTNITGKVIVEMATELNHE